MTMIDHSQVQFLEIGEGSDGQRLDNFLLRELKGVPKSRIYRLIRKGEVRVNRKRSKPDNRLHRGDQVRIPPIRVATSEQKPKPGADFSQFLLKRILFENELFLVINKPAGIAVHGGSGVRLGLIEAMRQLKPQWKELELAHRLDRDTSGCMIIAKDPIFLRQIHQQLKQKSVNKIYLALVQGYWPDQLIEVDAPLLKNYLRSGERVVRVDKSGKSSLTRFETVEHFGRGATLIKAMPVTGRTHQIRVHCQSTGHAILGDPKYACPGQPGSRPDIKKLCLHAASIEFEAPHGGKMFKFEAPLDEFMEAQFKLLRSQ